MTTHPLRGIANQPHAGGVIDATTVPRANAGYRSPATFTREQAQTPKNAEDTK